VKVNIKEEITHERNEISSRVKKGERDREKYER